jgi:hypothetical protein
MKKTLAVALAVTASAFALAACSADSEDEAGSESPTVATGAGDDSASAVASRPVNSTLVLPGGPRVIQTASVRLSIREGGFEAAVGRARTITAGLGGFVVSSSATQGRGRRPVDGTLELRVPARRYADAMGALARLGRVEVREESGQDVSQEFVDLEARARHLEAVETQLLALLRRAGTVSSALAVQSRLNEVQLQLEQVRGRMRFLEDQVSFATISLALVERRPEAGGQGWQIVDAWRDGAHGFVFVVGRIFVVLATIAPVLVLAVAAFLAARFARRRLVRA